MKWMLNCLQATRLASEALDRPLTRAEHWSLRLHLWMCPACRRFARQTRQLHQCVRTVAEARVFVYLPAARKTAIKQRLRQLAQSFSASENQNQEEEEKKDG